MNAEGRQFTLLTVASILITELITFSRDLPFSSRACGQPGLTLELFIK